jgi:hypothetical protein
MRRFLRIALALVLAGLLLLAGGYLNYRAKKYIKKSVAVSNQLPKTKAARKKAVMPQQPKAESNEEVAFSVKAVVPPSSLPLVNQQSRKTELVPAVSAAELAKQIPGGATGRICLPGEVPAFGKCPKERWDPWKGEKAPYHLRGPVCAVKIGGRCQ